MPQNLEIMKQLLIIPALLGIAFVSSAQSPVENPNERPKEFTPKNPRPQDRGEETKVWYTYSPGAITINFSQPEGRARMTVTRMEDAASHTISFATTAPYAYNMGTAPGTYVIVIKTSRQEYEALLQIE